MALVDILLFLHVFGAFALVSGTMAMAPFALGLGGALGRQDILRLAATGSILSGVGATLTLVIGLWLVGEKGYDFFRFWILGALALWIAAGASNDRVGRAARAELKGGGAVDIRTLWFADAIAAALLVAIMLFKPGV